MNKNFFLLFGAISVVLVLLYYIALPYKNCWNERESETYRWICTIPLSTFETQDLEKGAIRKAKEIEINFDQKLIKKEVLKKWKKNTPIEKNKWGKDAPIKKSKWGKEDKKKKK